MANYRYVNVLPTPSTNICSRFFINCCMCTLILYVISGLGNACTFPRHLRTTAMWMAKYKDGSTLNIYFKESHLTATRCSDDGMHCTAHTRKCLVKIGEDKYQVQHRLTSDQEPTRFLCMQILQRGKYIIQIRESSELVYRKANSCNDEHLYLDNWPLILTQKYSNQKIACPFSGGYNVVFHTSDRTPKCDKELIPARLESECEQGDGMTINFNDKGCIDKRLNMEIVQTVTCEAVWVHGNYTFIMIKKQADTNKHWCMRITGTDMTQPIKEAYLFIDLVCDPNDQIRETSKYLYLEFEQRIISSTCQDAYSKICTDRRVCETDTEDGIYKMHCRRSCNFCSGEEESCSFPGILRGDFLENSYNKMNQIRVDYYSMHISDTGLFRCHEPEGHDFENNTMLFQTFENGCYPRFACFELRKPAASILEYRLGNRVGWPIKHWDRLKDEVCSDEMFEPNAKDKELYGKNIVEKPTKILVDMQHHFQVNCELSLWHGLVDSRIYMQEENVCDYCFIHDPSTRHTRDRLVTQPLNCTSAGNQDRRSYHCLGAFPQDENTHAIVTRTLHLHQEYLCWVFVYENDNEERVGTVYILEATNCNKVAIGAVKEGTMEPKRKFIIPKSSPRACPYLPMDTTPTTYPPITSHSDKVTSYSRPGKKTTPYDPIVNTANTRTSFTTQPPLYPSMQNSNSANKKQCTLTLLAITTTITLLISILT